MTIYEKFEELISTHNILILDNPEWCKAFFRKAGFNEDNLGNRLFYILLDKNITLEIRKVSYRKNLKTDFNIAVTVYAKMFDSLTVPNDCEDILIKHIIGIIDTLNRRNIIYFEYISDFIDYRDFSNLRDAVEEMVRYFSAKILSDYIRIKAYLRDISRNMVEEFDIKSFIVFLTALNAENVVFSFTNKRNIYFLSLLDSALEKTGNTYAPLEKQKQYLQEQKEFRKIV